MSQRNPGVNVPTTPGPTTPLSRTPLPTTTPPTLNIPTTNASTTQSDSGATGCKHKIDGSQEDSSKRPAVNDIRQHNGITFSAPDQHPPQYPLQRCPLADRNPAYQNYYLHHFNAPPSYPTSSGSQPYGRNVMVKLTFPIKWKAGDELALNRAIAHIKAEFPDALVKMNLEQEF